MNDTPPPPDQERFGLLENRADHLPARPKRSIQRRWGLLILGFIVLLIVGIFERSLHSSAEGGAFWSEVALLFFAESGVALIVASVIANTIDFQARQAEIQEREEDQRKEEEAKRLMAQNVVQGVFGIQHDPKYVKSVIQSTLHPFVVRRRAVLEYSLRDLTDEEAKHLCVEKDRFVVLKMLSTYTFLNNSEARQQVPIRYSVAQRHGGRLREFTKVVRATIDKKELSPEDLSKDVSNCEDDLTYTWLRWIKGNSELPVEVIAETIKERSDNEVWGSYFPTVEGANLRLEVLPNMVYGIRPLTSARISGGREDDRIGRWECEGAILPNDSVVFWWRTPADDGEPIPGREC